MKSIKASSSQQLKVKVAEALGRVNLKELLSQHYPLLSVLIGFLLVALSIGPYYNGDTAWEYDAVNGVINYGLPYTNGFYLMDQPPLGFYIQAAFFSTFGLSINNGTFLVTLFGLGCVALVYSIGAVTYNKTTGFFAALLFAFSPWHLILSRAFLIDVPCLFFSLSSLLVGIFAIRKNSLWLFAASGILFTAAINTKLYAAFTLIPLTLLFLYYGTKKPKRILGSAIAFLVPVSVFHYLWYQTISGMGVFSIFGHTDFSVPNPFVTVSSPVFIVNFLINYGLGWFFVDSILLSMLFYAFGKRLFGRFWFFEACCLAVIGVVLSINLYLGASLQLKAPFLNAIKYDYHALPFFSFLAASLVTKSAVLFSIAKTKTKPVKRVFSLAGVVGVVLVLAAVIYNMRFVHLFSTSNYLIFKVDPYVNVGYSLFNSVPITQNSLLMIAQYLGFAIALSGLVWLGLSRLHKTRLRG